MLRIPTYLALFTVILLGAQPGWADNGLGQTEVNFKDYTLHYNIFPSTFLQAHIAKAVGIKRSPNRSVLTVALKKQGGANAPAVKAVITSNVSNLIGQVRPIELKEIKDGDAIYYIGDFRTVDQENLKFQIMVRPEGDTFTHNLIFERRF